MMSSPDYCIDIAVDHRLKRLVRTVPVPDTSNTTNHCQLLRNLPTRITRPKEPITDQEIDFTAWLARPNTDGGIIVLLERPANNHPYHLGRAITFSSCTTLIVLDQCFSFVSRGSITLNNVSVIDSLPYTREKDNINAQYKYDLRHQVFLILQAKRPQVTLCMWQEKEQLPLSIARFKSVGVGKTFSKSLIHLGHHHRTRRINAFHPSYAVRYRSSESAFRQLLLLEVARACGELRGDWREEEWMQELRCHCRQKARERELGIGYVANADKSCRYVANILCQSLFSVKFGLDIDYAD